MAEHMSGGARKTGRKKRAKHRRQRERAGVDLKRMTKPKPPGSPGNLDGGFRPSWEK